MEPISSIGVEESETMQTSGSKVFYFGLEFFFERDWSEVHLLVVFPSSRY
jgi:hypothetical protein